MRIREREREREREIQTTCQCPKCKVDASWVAGHSDFAERNVYWCNACSYGFVNPLPDDSFLATHYSKEYRSKAIFSDAYVQIMQNRAKAQLEYITNAIGTLPKGRIIDIGCGIGAFVRLCNASGFAALGVEMDPVATEFGKAHMTPAIFSEIPEKIKQVSGVVLSHVIEHLPSPEETLLQYLNFPGIGFFFIEVPNCTSESIRLLEHESHLHFFTPESLRATLESLPIEVVALDVFGPNMAKEISRTLFTNYIPPHAHPWDGLYGMKDPHGLWIRAVCKCSNKEIL